MNIAIIPWNDTFLRDKMFDIDDLEFNHDHCMNHFFLMREEFVRHGDTLHTIDFFQPEEVDFFLFFDLNLSWLKILADKHLEAKAIYCNAEPPVVNPLNDKEGFAKLLNYFPYIMTWNDELVDNQRIFKRNIPYYFENQMGNIPFEKRKLLTCISGNKHSDHPDELYSEREKLITFLEHDWLDKFDFYGSGWNKGTHPAYGGRIENKAEIYHKYRFAIAFENMKNVKGYISEKILDCITSGIVPVYWGAENITEYIPEDCFIDYRKFSNVGELVRFLDGMDEKEYQNYLDAAQQFLRSEKVKLFSGEEYARDIYYLFEYAKLTDFSLNKRAKHKLFFKVYREKITDGIKRLVTLR